MKILSLNCQRGFQAALESFLHQTFENREYNILLLQEVDDKVFSFLNHSSYKALRVFNDETEQESQTCIVYRQGYKLIKNGFQSFASMRNDPWKGFKHPSFGIFWVDLSIDNEPLRVGSLHLHSGIDRKARAAELRLAKELFLKDTYDSAILSGDFNAGYPGEVSNMAKILAPELVCESKDIGPTLDSRLSENLPHLPNRIAAFLSLLNLRIPLWTDHFFVDSETHRKYKIKCRALPDRVSDHSPVEIVIS